MTACAGRGPKLRVDVALLHLGGVAFRSRPAALHDERRKRWSWRVDRSALDGSDPLRGLEALPPGAGEIEAEFAWAPAELRERVRCPLDRRSRHSSRLELSIRQRAEPQSDREVLFGAWDHGEPDIAFETMDDEITWDARPLNTLGHYRRVYRGHDGVRAFWRGRGSRHGSGSTSSKALNTVPTATRWCPGTGSGTVERAVGSPWNRMGVSCGPS